MASRESALEISLLALPVALFFLGQGHFPHVFLNSELWRASDTNLMPPNEAKGSTGNVKSTWAAMALKSAPCSV